MTFDGSTYDEKRDGARLSTQLERVRGMFTRWEGRWFSLEEIAAYANGTEAAVSARLRDLRKPKFGSLNIERKNLGGGLWVYRLAPKPAHTLQTTLF